MAAVCKNCGAPLRTSQPDGSATCMYCGQRHSDAPAPASDKQRQRQIGGPIALTAALVLVGIAVAAFLHSRNAPPPAPVAPPPEVIAPAPITAPQPQADSVDGETPAPEPPDAPHMIKGRAPGTAAATEKPSDPGRKKPPKAPAPSGPVLTKAEAEKVLKPKLSACMAQHNIHYLIATIGQGYVKYRPGTLPPLKIVNTPYVDYRPEPKFGKTALGRCVLAAANTVQTSAFKGNYMHFELRNPGTPDPLAGLPGKIDRTEADKILAVFDDAARACGRTAPDGSRAPGERLRVDVTFQGFDGRPIRVEPSYIKQNSPYAKCLKKVYGKAVVPRFRNLKDRVHRTFIP